MCECTVTFAQSLVLLLGECSKTPRLRLKQYDPRTCPQRPTALICHSTVSSSPPPKARSRKHHRRQAGTSVTRRQRDGDGEGEVTGACPSPIIQNTSEGISDGHNTRA